MIKSIRKLSLVTIFAALALSMPMSASPQMTNMPPSTAPAKPFPYRGKIIAVDTAKMTFTLDGKATNRVFEVTSATKLMKAGKPATLSEAPVGEVVTGQCTKTPDGKYVAKSVYIGGKTPTPAPAVPAPTVPPAK